MANVIHLTPKGCHFFGPHCITCTRPVCWLVWPLLAWQVACCVKMTAEAPQSVRECAGRVPVTKRLVFGHALLMLSDTYTVYTLYTTLLYRQVLACF